jgi:Tfp pilus assembly protein PilO
MNTKSIFSLLLFLISGLFLYSFVLPFKTSHVDPISDQLEKISNAYSQANSGAAIDRLKIKKNSLSEQELNLLQNFIPNNLHAGTFVYNLAQLANQSRLTLKGLQYTVIEDTLKPNAEKKLAVEFVLDGRYEDFYIWLQNIDRSNILIDVDSFRGVKNSNNSDVITFNIKMYTYGININ